MHALRRVSAFFGAAAPLGCVTLFAIWQCCYFFVLRAGSSAHARYVVSLPRRALRASETLDDRLSNGLFAVF